MSDRDQVLGIDFGTANSYFCKFFARPANHRIRVIDFGNNQVGGMATTILYREGRDPVVGSTAEQEWGDAAPAERRGYRLRTHFKPEIASDPEAFGDAVAFLRTLREQMARRRVDFAPENHRVIIGLPGEAGPDYREALLSVAREAGYGEVRLVFEPIGALLYHLWNTDIAPSEAQRGVLVVDFGGGTCDFAFMQRLEVAHAWGDMALGGRLFDDLFFQWFLEQNPGVLERLRASGDEYYVHWLECRRAKEFFSERMAVSRDETLRMNVGQRGFGTLEGLTWAAFEERARRYRPHSGFLDILRRRAGSDRLTEDSPIDLFAWFRETFVAGLEKHRIRTADIERVILTGGSSQWPFVQDIVTEVLHLSAERLLTSENPKAAISEGLVVLPSIQHRHEQAERALVTHLPDFFRDRIEPEINRRLDALVDRVVEDIAAQLYDGEVRPVVTRFREEGGTIAGLKQRIRDATIRRLPELETHIREQLAELQQGLPAVLHREVVEWFREQEVTYFATPVAAEAFSARYRADRTARAAEGALRLEAELTHIIGTLVISISAAIVASLSGGGGIALISGGPLGWVVGAVATVLAGAAVMIAGKKPIDDMVERIPLPAQVVKLVLREGRLQAILQEGRARLRSELTAEIEQLMEEPVREMTDGIRANIRREIDSLSLINHL